MQNNVIVFFDGYCNLCNGSVDFIIRNEMGNELKFASLQSSYAIKTLADLDYDEESILVYANGKLSAYSDAAILISKHLKFPYSILKYSAFIPKSLRDVLYKFIAKNRYKWFGKKDSCRIPTRQEQNKFLG